MDRPDRVVAWRIDRSDQGVRLSGRLPTPDAAKIVARVLEMTKDARSVEIDLGDVEEIDPDVVALLGAELRSRSVTFRLRGGDRFHALFEQCTEGVPAAGRVRCPEEMLSQIGRETAKGVVGLERLLGFVGELTAAVGRLVRRPRAGHWKDVPLLVERAGFDALPILLVINFLIGFVMAYMCARYFAEFGANTYVADLVAIAMTRQLGPLMTGVVVCGRSGAAFATELGSMKVAQEVDALRTFGLQPFEWLVLPRIVTLVLVFPVLTLLADLVGMLGGLLVAVTSLGLSAGRYLRETRNALQPWDVGSGLVLSVAFATAVGVIACEQGLAASEGPVGVGRRTTSTVVMSLFAMVAMDALLTVAFRLVGLS